MATHVTKTPARSDLGTVRKLPSGHYQASFRTNGERFTAPQTFRTKDDARGWLATQRADRLRGTWRDPHQGEVNFAEYMSDWFGSRQIAERSPARLLLTVRRDARIGARSWPAT